MADYHPGSDPLIRLQGVSKVHGAGEGAVVALADVNLEVPAGGFLAVMGPSGSGKSTLMNILGCLDTATSGAYLFAGDDVSRLTEHQLARVRNLRIGFVFQQFQLLPRMSALENVELPLLYRRTDNRRARALQALDQVGLANRVSHRPTELSGGQQQRVAIARALVTNPDLILADEPTGNLDSVSSAEILGILRRLHEEGRTIILITHEADVAAVAESAVDIRDGRLSRAVAA